MTNAKITISRLRQADLKGLDGFDDQGQVRGFAEPHQYVTVTHKAGKRVFEYRFGRFDSWRGPFWMHDRVSNSVFTGSLDACKDFAKLCTECVREGEA